MDLLDPRDERIAALESKVTLLEERLAAFIMLYNKHAHHQKSSGPDSGTLYFQYTVRPKE